MRALLPEPASDVDLLAAYATPSSTPSDRPFLRCNMVASVDGAITVDGRAAGLGGPADQEVLRVLRALADIVIVGAGTARAEHYGPVRLAAPLRSIRIAKGQPPVPAIAIVTGSGSLDWSSPFFTDAEVPPVIVTTEDGEANVRHGAGARADVVVAGASHVDMSRAILALSAMGHGTVLLEGGPRLNGDVVRAGLLDELCLTLSPHLVGGDGPRLLASGALSPPLTLELRHLLEDDGMLFLRLCVARADDA